MYRFVYMTTNKITGKKYIGKHTTNDLNDGYFGSNEKLLEDIKTLGKENFKREILEFAQTANELTAKESYHLRKNKVVEREDFYNETYVASGGRVPFETWSPERYQKYIEHQRKVQTGKKRSQKTRERISKNNVGFKGKNHTEESRKKISEVMKNKYVNKEARLRLSQINLGSNNPSSKAVLLINKDMEVVKKFGAKYIAEEWFYEQGYCNSRSRARYILKPYIEEKRLWNDMYYFILEREYNSFILEKISS